MTIQGIEKNQNTFVTVHTVDLEWTAPDDPNLKRWRLIVGQGDELMWAYTYNPALAKLGTHRVAFYRDTSMRPSIRTPKKGASDEANNTEE